jgi:hypothetical protein
MGTGPIETFNASVIGGTGQRVCVHNDRVTISPSYPPYPGAEEIRYEQIADLNLYIGAFYATLTLGTHGGHRLMVRWLPKRKAVRVANLIRERVRAA